MADGKKNIAVLIDVYSRFGGACKAAIIYANEIKGYGYQSFVVCNNALPGETIPEGVNMLSCVCDCRNFLIKNEIDVVHYFKAAKGLLNNSIFSKTIKAIKKTNREIRVVTTVCQQPSYGLYILTPFEIRNSEHIFFIDKTAYNDPMFKFILEERKSWIYMTASKGMLRSNELDNYVKQDYEIKNNTIIFGRGSTLNKCPKDVLDVYGRIKTHQIKKFVIVGVPEGENWLTKKIARCNTEEIETHPMLLPKDYFITVSSFDILLYYLPKDSYSSRDGSLRDAMRLGLPVVIYGPRVLKETVTNGIDGFYAETKDEFVKYAEMLANDTSLRETLGRNARRLYFEEAPETRWTKVYTQIIEELCNNQKAERIKCPFRDVVKIYFKRDISWIATVFRKGSNVIIKKV